MHNSKAVANYSQLVPCYLFTPFISRFLEPQWQDFRVGDRESCATEFWKGKSSIVFLEKFILKCFPRAFNSNLLWGEKIKGLSAPETVCSRTEEEHVGEEGFGSVTLFFF